MGGLTYTLLMATKKKPAAKKTASKKPAAKKARPKAVDYVRRTPDDLEAIKAKIVAFVQKDSSPSVSVSQIAKGTRLDKAAIKRPIFILVHTDKVLVQVGEKRSTTYKLNPRKKL